MTLEERMTVAALATLDVAQRSGINEDDLENEIRASAARLIYRQAEANAKAQRETSFHEAAHAVIGFVLGLPVLRAGVGVEDASINPTLGRVIFDPCQLPDDLDGIRDRVTMLSVGPAAERRVGGFPKSDGDRIQANILALRLNYSDRARESFLNFCWVRADDLVRDHWAWIARVADLLLASGTVTAADVERLRSEPVEAAA